MRRWRKEAEATLRLERGGHHDEAIARAEELVAKHPESALVANRLAPNCVKIATNLAMLRFVCIKDNEADLDILRDVLDIS
ncbi:hypothetical protein GUJ93_ZPchr0013g34207 [Zizania palustris]|uniref:Tetratricopeptide repeat protein n=1 Tax=Zizania palustris TaxID=103762 RepID=A0A8J5WYV2_ZIZPA|nr:hypothetical protein GUJ93_ZPchr0013g34207 [Zizania palustris]